MRLGVLLLCLALAGCYKVDLDLTVDPDDTISGSMIFGITRDLPGGGEILNQMRSSLPPGTEVQDWSDDRFLGFKITYDKAPISALGSDSRATGSAITLRRDGDFYILGDPAADPDLPDLGGFTPVYLIRFTFPGEVVEGNGVKDGRSMEWTDPSIPPYAKAEAGGSSMVPIVLICVGVAVLAAAVVVAIVVLRRKGTPPALVGGPAQPPHAEWGQQAQAPWGQQAQAPGGQQPQQTHQPRWGHDEPTQQVTADQTAVTQQGGPDSQSWSGDQSWSGEDPGDGPSPWARP